MDDVAFGALALSLTLVGGTYTYFAYQRRGLAAGLRGAALTLLPLAAYLTDTLRMFTRIGDAVGDWATGLAFSPSVWIGVIVAGLSVVLFGASRVVGGSSQRHEVEKKTSTKTTPAVGRDTSPPVVDDDLAEIQAILRKRGIS